MDAMKLRDALGATLIANKVRAKIDGVDMVLARLNGDKWELTADGEKMAAKVNAAVKVEEQPVEKKVVAKKPAKTKTRKAE